MSARTSDRCLRVESFSLTSTQHRRSRYTVILEVSQILSFKITTVYVMSSSPTVMKLSRKIRTIGRWTVVTETSRVYLH